MNRGEWCKAVQNDFFLTKLKTERYTIYTLKEGLFQWKKEQ